MLHAIHYTYFGGGLLNSFLGVGPGAIPPLFSWEVKEIVLVDSGVTDILSTGVDE